jgi:hypothetical protein
MVLLLVLMGCIRTDAADTRSPRPLPEGNEAEDTDPGELPQDTDTGDPPDTDPIDTGDPIPSGAQACFLGPDRDHAACLPTFLYDPGLMGPDYDYPDPYDGSPQYAAPARYLDLSNADPTFEVAPNFVLDEFVSLYKGRWGVLQSHLIDVLQEMRDDLGEPLIVTSGYRSPDYNAGVGGVTYSRHQYGDAVDLDVEGMSVEELGVVCEQFDADYVGLYEDGHTHCDWREAPLDPAFYDAGRSAPISAGPRPSARLDRIGNVFTAPAEGFDEGAPLRVWRAWDASGSLLDEATGRSYAPPAGAARVTVTVGGHERLEATL